MQEDDSCTAASFDVISHESNSWFTSEHRIDVPVWDGDSKSLMVAARKRLFRFNLREAHDVYVSQPMGSIAVPSPKEQRHCLQALQLGNTAPRLTAKEDERLAVARLKVASVGGEVSARDKSIERENETLKRQLTSERARATELREFVNASRTSTWESVVIDNLPVGILEWLSPTWVDEREWTR